jgi:hypothetical protein
MSKYLLKTLVFAIATTSLTMPCISSAQAPAATPADASATYAPTDLNFTYTPPAGWKSQDVSTVKSSADDKSASCMKVLYTAAPESASQGIAGMSIGVTLIDAARNCVPADVTAEVQVQTMVENAAKMPGMQVSKKPNGYFIDNHTFWSMVAKGKPTLGDGSTAKVDVYVAMVGGVVKDKVLIWELTAPDQATMQQMLSSTVQFTGKKPHILAKIDLK